MALLSKDKRKEYFRVLGYTYNTEGIYKIQKDYFTRPQDIDGKYGTDTDRLVVNLYRIRKYAPHFSITEFKCHCGGKYCTGYPAKLSVSLLKNLEEVRAHFGTPVKITSGIRCKKWNSLQVGSAAQSRHISGKAADIYGAFTNSAQGRKATKTYWYMLPDVNYCYYGTANMGNVVHVDVK